MKIRSSQMEEACDGGMRRGAASFFGYVAIVSLLAGFYLAAFISAADSYRNGIVSGFMIDGSLNMPLVAMALVMSLLIFACIFVFDRYRAIARWLIAHRYILSLALLALCCLLEISGSSVAIWGEYLDGSRAEGTLFGIPRSIRSDEWCVTTPFEFSQVETGDNQISPVIRGGETDVTLVPMLASWSLATVFRPYYWGFLLLGASRGLSFFWVGRLLALALVTFEFARLLTNKNDALSCLAAMLVTFAPIVQWWNAPNLLIFGQGLVLCLYALLKAGRTSKRWLLSLLLLYLLCCYAFELYPAWQVPFFYVFASAGAWVIIKVKNQKGVTYWELIKPIIAPVVIALCLVVAFVIIAVSQAWDVCLAVSGTTYPGSRLEHGGQMLHGIAFYLKCNTSTIASALVPEAIMPNVCEAAAVIALSPLGLILLMLHFARYKDREALFLLVPYIFFLFFGILGFPDLLARVTLMSNVTAKRLMLPLGYLDVMMLVYVLSVGASQVGLKKNLHEKPGPSIGIMPAFVASLILATCYILLASRVFTDSSVSIAYILIGGVSFLGALAVLAPKRSALFATRGKDEYLLAWVVLVICIGVSINPIQQGVSAIIDSEYVGAVKAVVNKDPDGLWVADGSVQGQACIVAGAKTLNSVNSYPNLERWHMIDPDRAYEDIYNRYAHIGVEMSDELEFTLIAGDSFIVGLDEQSVDALGIDYWISQSTLERFNSDHLRFIPIETVGSYTIYQVLSV